MVPAAIVFVGAHTSTRERVPVITVAVEIVGARAIVINDAFVGRDGDHIAEVGLGGKVAVHWKNSIRKTRAVKDFLFP